MGDVRSDSQKLLDKTIELGAKPEAPASADLTLDREIVEKIVRDYNCDLDLISYEIEAGSSLGDGFTAVLLALKFLAKNRKNGGKIEEIQLMVKTLPKNEMRKKFLIEFKAFNKETRFYTEILKDFEEFQRSKGIPEEDMFLAYPTVYSSIIDGNNDYIAMDNLKLSGHLMGTKRGLDLQHCTVTLKNLAKVHAISYGKFGGDGEAIMNKYPFLTENLFEASINGEPSDIMKNFLMMFKHSFVLEKDLLTKKGHTQAAAAFDDIDVDKLPFYLNKMCSKPNSKATIGLGDVWTNNMLFKYGPGGRIVDIKFLDFQICRCSSRMVDLGYFLHTSADVKLLNEKQMTLLKIYFDEFVRFGLKLGIPSDDIAFDYDDFLQEFNDYRYSGFIMGLMTCPMMFADKEDIPDMNDLDEDKMKSGEGMGEFMGGLIKGDALIRKVNDLLTIHWPKAKPTLKKWD